MTLEKYKKKYRELSLTGNVPTHPKYLYEYFLPNDFLEAIELVPFDERDNKSFEVYLNFNNDLVLSTNITPVVLCYHPKGV